MTHQIVAPTPSQEASARAHLAQRDAWRYARNKQTGAAFIAVPSATSGRVYTVHPAAAACSCPFYQRTGRRCSHMRAVELAHDEDAAAEYEIEAAFAAVAAKTEPAWMAAGRRLLAEYGAE